MVAIEQIAVIAVERGRPFRPAQVTMAGKDVIAQFKPEGVRSHLGGSAIACSPSLPGPFQE
jgi:hypothetical protein